MVMIPEAYGRKGLGYFKGPIKESGRVTLMPGLSIKQNASVSI